MAKNAHAQNGRPVQLICPCLIERKDMMTKFYPAAVGDTANAGSDNEAPPRTVWIPKLRVR